jgi:hypothetical protein
MDLKSLIDFKFPPIEQTYSKTDSMIYALGLGYGTRPLDEPSSVSFRAVAIERDVVVLDRCTAKLN